MIYDERVRVGGVRLRRVTFFICLVVSNIPLLSFICRCYFSLVRSSLFERCVVFVPDQREGAERATEHLAGN
jgi:hypothetical protein